MYLCERYLQKKSTNYEKSFIQYRAWTHRHGGLCTGIKGKWLTEAGDAQVEIYEHNGKVNGKIVWLQKGPDTKDVHNNAGKLKLIARHGYSGH